MGIKVELRCLPGQANKAFGGGACSCSQASAPSSRSMHARAYMARAWLCGRCRRLNHHRGAWGNMGHNTMRGFTEPCLPAAALAALAAEDPLMKLATSTGWWPTAAQAYGLLYPQPLSACPPAVPSNARQRRPRHAGRVEWRAGGRRAVAANARNAA